MPFRAVAVPTAGAAAGLSSCLRGHRLGHLNAALRSPTSSHLLSPSRWLFRHQWSAQTSIHQSIGLAGRCAMAPQRVAEMPTQPTAASDDGIVVANAQRNAEGDKAGLLRARLESLGLRYSTGTAVPVMDVDEFDIIPQAEIPEGGRVVKSLIWEYSTKKWAGGASAPTPVVVVLSLEKMVCKDALGGAIAKMLARREDCSEQPDVSVRLMPRAAAEEYGGYTMGNVPPAGHTHSMQTMIDSALFQAGGAQQDVYGGGGQDGWELRARLQGLVKCSDATIAPLSLAGASRQRPPEAAKLRQTKDKTAAGQAQSRRGAQPDADPFVPTGAAIRKAAVKADGAEELDTLLSLCGCRKTSPDGSVCDDCMGKVNAGTDQSGKTPLHLAAWRGSVESVELLLAAGADINSFSTGAGNYGKTAIFYALTRCRDCMVKVLLERGADVLICNNKGQTPLSIAVSHVKPETVALLEAAEAKQEADGRSWKNFRATHSDFKRYGDLDPRFGLDAANGWPPECDDDISGAKSIRPTTPENRRARVDNRSRPPWQTSASPEAAKSAAPERSPLPVLNVGTSMCHLVGVITSKRRIGKALAFINIVPPPDPEVPAMCSPFAGTGEPSSADKHAWQDGLAAAHGEQPRGLAVQLIIGRTLKQRIGFEAAVEVIRGLRVGQLVYATGRLGVNGERGQENLQKNSTVDVVTSEVRVLQERYRVVPELRSSAEDTPGVGDCDGSTIPLPNASQPRFLNLDDVFAAAPTLSFSRHESGSSCHPRVSLVDRVEALQDLQGEIEWVKTNSRQSQARAVESCVGLDCEWQPGPGGGRENPVALLQLATCRGAFLIDLQTLCRRDMDAAAAMNKTEAAVNWTIRRLFSEKKVCILGFGMWTDLKKLAVTFPHMPCFRSAESVIDIKALLHLIYPGSPNLAQNISLSKLCGRLLGKELDKSQQCSDWACRPLTQEQMLYASMDAAVLLELFRHLASAPSVCGCETEECVQRCILTPSSQTDDGPRHILKRWALR